MRVALCALIAILLAPAVGAQVPKVAPDGPIWNTSPGFAFPGADEQKLRRSLSGIACPGSLSGTRRCIAAFDEGGEARYALIDGMSLVPQPEQVGLMVGKGELDAEGAAHDGTFVYITGSHSRKRDKCKANKDSRHVYRLTLQPDGRVHLPVDDNGRLWRAMSDDDILHQFVDKCLGDEGHGINIEGIAARNGQLYFGFREPARDKTAFILRVAAVPLFEGGNLAPRLFHFEAGKGSGVRDLLAVPEGILVLVGPDDDSQDGIPWWIGFWDGRDTANKIDLRPLAELILPAVSGKGCQKEIKPEAMTLLADGPDFRRVLILSDGLCDGGPLAFVVPK